MATVLNRSRIRPAGPAAHRVAEQIFLRCGVQIDGAGPTDIHIHDPRVYRRLLTAGSLGLGESYMDGWWEAESLDGLLFRLIRGQAADDASHWRNRLAWLRTRVLNPQRGRGAYRVGERHYDRGNALFEAMLDRRMIYSCGYWQSATNLDAAQEAKLDLVFGKLGLKPGDHVLDIGCGWGGALRYAAERYGVSGVGVTISSEQADYARRVCAGLPIEIRLQDYRAVDDTFDHLWSIGMFEHVGARNYRMYMQVARRCLRPGGRFLLHTIGSARPDHQVDPWIERYIFPHSMLPSQVQIVEALAGLFAIDGWQRIGTDYDPTLLAWRARFERWWAAQPQPRDERFFRMWRYYLSACAASFRARRNDVWQLLLVPQA